VTSLIHAYGTLLPPSSFVDHVPARPRTEARATTRATFLAPPIVSTRVDLPPPPAWGPPNPDLLLSLMIAPLRFEPANWSAPTVIVAPWPAPQLPMTPLPMAQFEQRPVAAEPPTRRHWLGLKLAGLAVGSVAVVGTVAAIIASR
jgi:hypothetical protein